VAKAGEIDVVGYEYELALEMCRDEGVKPVLVITGEDSEDGVLRVIRQTWRGESLVLTCAREVWS